MENNSVNFCILHRAARPSVKAISTYVEKTIALSQNSEVIISC